MSSLLKRHSGVLAILPATIAILFIFSSWAAAQDPPAPKWEVYGGYSFLYPNSYLHAMLPGGVLPVGSPLESNPWGLGGSLTYDFRRWFGLTLDGSMDFHSGETGLAMRIDDTAFSNLSFGPKFTYRTTHVAPFLEALVGDHRLAPDAFHDINKLGFMFGGGLDFKVSKHLALRLPRVDYVMSSYRYGPSATTRSTDLRGHPGAGWHRVYLGRRTKSYAASGCLLGAAGQRLCGRAGERDCRGIEFQSATQRRL